MRNLKRQPEPQHEAPIGETFAAALAMARRGGASHAIGGGRGVASITALIAAPSPFKITAHLPPDVTAWSAAVEAQLGAGAPSRGAFDRCGLTVWRAERRVLSVVADEAGRVAAARITSGAWRAELIALAAAIRADDQANRVRGVRNVTH